LIRFGQIWLDLGNIWVNLGEIWADLMRFVQNKKSCISQKFDLLYGYAKVSFIPLSRIFWPKFLLKNTFFTCLNKECWCASKAFSPWRVPPLAPCYMLLSVITLKF